MRQAAVVGRIALLLTAAGLLAAPAPSPAKPAVTEAGCARTTLADVEGEVMCPTCRTTLNVANGPQAERERELIRQAISDCKSKEEIKALLVGEFGSGVLALPPKSGFNLAVWIVPGLALLTGLVVLVAMLRRWRRERPTAAPPERLDPDEAAHLQRDLEEHDV